MDLQPQVSFIPKKPLTSSPISNAGTSSIVWIIAVFIFAVSVVAAIGVFGYTLYLQHQIDLSKSSLDTARAAYDPSSIEDLVRLNTRIEQAKSLLANHLAPSALFTFLESNTLSTVRFTNFAYVADPDGSMKLKLTGNAVDFASVAQQSDQFDATSSVRVLKNVIFSDISIDPTTGIVSFQVDADVNPDVILYSSNLPSADEASSASTNSNSTLPTSISVSSSSTPAVSATSASTSASVPSTPQPIPPSGAANPSAQ